MWHNIGDGTFECMGVDEREGCGKVFTAEAKRRSKQAGCHACVQLRRRNYWNFLQQQEAGEAEPAGEAEGAEGEAQGPAKKQKGSAQKQCVERRGPPRLAWPPAAA